MPTYTITQILDSHVELPYRLVVDSFSFEYVSTTTGRELLVVGTTEASDFSSATEVFDKRLLQILDALALQQRVAVSAFGASTLVDRLDSKYVLLHAVRRFDSPGAVLFREEARDELVRLSGAFQDDNEWARAAASFRQSLLAFTPLDAALHLLRAVEAIAGTELRRRKMP